MPIKIHLGDEAAYARHLAQKSVVERSDLSVGFEPSQAFDPLLLVEGKQFYPRMLEDIANATSSIHINEFGVRPGVVADRFEEVLLARAGDGIPVRMIVDARGSVPDGESKEMFERLAAGGIEIFVNQPFAPFARAGALGTEQEHRWNVPNLLAVDHRKFIIIDGRIGWLGTAGIEDRFEDGRHHDLFVRVEGPIVHQLQAVFLASYRWHGGAYETSEIERLFPKADTSEAGVPALVLHNAPGKYRPISMEIIELITAARRSLDIMNPYVAHPQMFQLLVDAAQRGVKVRLIVPPSHNTLSTGYARLYHHAELLDAGAEIWTYPSVAHAKAFVRDDEDVLVGSCNLETWSLRRFFEIDIRLQSAELADQFKTKLFDPDVAVSTPGQPARGVKERVLSTAFYLVSPFL